MSTPREELDRLLKLYRTGKISEEVFLDQIGSPEFGSVDGGLKADREITFAEGSDEMPVDEQTAPAGADQPTSDAQQLIEILDRFRAAEASGAETLELWAMKTEDEGLVGGLRVMAAREYAHVALLEQRLDELGAVTKAEIPSWLANFNRALIADESNDLERLGAFLSQLGDPEAAVGALDEAIVAAGDDQLTRELLIAIKADELASIGWFRAAFAERSND